MNYLCKSQSLLLTPGFCNMLLFSQQLDRHVIGSLASQRDGLKLLLFLLKTSIYMLCPGMCQ